MSPISSNLNGLNDAQKEAVLCIHGPLLVLAGAGAGKTRVIVQRIVQLVQSGVDPREILAITFTNKAAGEMRERVKAALAGDLLPFVSTFHSLGLTIIKENYRLLGLKRFPAIYDRSDSTRAIKEALKAMGADTEMEPRGVLGTISRQKGEGVTASEYADAAQSYRERTVAQAWLAYERILAVDTAFDFDDLLLRAEKFLREHEAARAQYQTRWKYLHIDEYQDTNRIQARLARHLIGAEQHVCAVGDIDQTIYGWRGAQIENMLKFEITFKGARVIVLEENYRSTKNILSAANDIIAKNNNRVEKNLYTKNADGALISLYQAFDETDEAMFVARTIRDLIDDKKAKPSDFAVLYRANFQSRALEEALLRAHVPYQVLGTRFFERKEVKDVLSFIKAAIYETTGDIARIANVPVRGLGKVTILKMLAGREGELTGAIGAKVAAFRKLLAHIKEAASHMTPAELVTYVIKESGVEQMYREDKLEGAERLENIKELVSLAARYKTAEDFLEASALSSDQDELKDEADAVRLMTVHASKGLEYKYIFITGLEEGLFPYEREDSNAASNEEERRLMYVALTRAKEKLYLTYAAYRTVFGSKNATLPSQFLSDLPQGILELEAPERLGRTIYLD